MANYYTNNEWRRFDNQTSRFTTSNEVDDNIFAAFNNSSQGMSFLDNHERHNPSYAYSYKYRHPHVDFDSPVNLQSTSYRSWSTRQNSSASSESSFTPSWSQIYPTSPFESFASHQDYPPVLDPHNIGTSPCDRNAQIYAHDHARALELLRAMGPDLSLPPNPLHPTASTLPHPSMRDAQIPPHCGRYVHPFVAFELFCRKPTIPTDEIDEKLFPPDEWAKVMDDGKRRCNVKGSITHEGRAEWKDSHGPCGHLLGHKDSYRRHILHFHLGIRREDGKKQNEWIEERWNEARQYQ